MNVYSVVKIREGFIDPSIHNRNLKGQKANSFLKKNKKIFQKLFTEVFNLLLQFAKNFSGAFFTSSNLQKGKKIKPTDCSVSFVSCKSLLHGKKKSLLRGLQQA
ncbi:MAG: hypothetical protein LUH51_05955 [Firmicutes bacterium]|nr:hypothetical protein [Bacillota bacterium]